MNCDVKPDQENWDNHNLEIFKENPKKYFIQINFRKQISSEFF